MVISLLMSSVLVDISIIIPALSDVGRWLPARIFLDVCQGDLSRTVVLLGGSFVCLVAAAATDHLRRPRKSAPSN
jgi:hypothetical protein